YFIGLYTCLIQIVCKVNVLYKFRKFCNRLGVIAKVCVAVLLISKEILSQFFFKINHLVCGLYGVFMTGFSEQLGYIVLVFSKRLGVGLAFFLIIITAQTQAWSAEIYCVHVRVLQIRTYSPGIKRVITGLGSFNEKFLKIGN